MALRLTDAMELPLRVHPQPSRTRTEWSAGSTRWKCSDGQSGARLGRGVSKGATLGFSAQLASPTFKTSKRLVGRIREMDTFRTVSRGRRPPLQQARPSC